MVLGHMSVDIKAGQIGGNVSGVQHCASEAGDTYLTLQLSEGVAQFEMLVISDITVDLEAVLMSGLPGAESVNGTTVVHKAPLTQVKWVGYVRAAVSIGDSSGPDLPNVNFLTLDASCNFTIVSEPAVSVQIGAFTLDGSFAVNVGNGAVIMGGEFVNGFTYPCFDVMAAKGFAEMHLGNDLASFDMDGLEFEASFYCQVGSSKTCSPRPPTHFLPILLSSMTSDDVAATSTTTF
jgi:hypothetical protein